MFDGDVSWFTVVKWLCNLQSIHIHSISTDSLGGFCILCSKLLYEKVHTYGWCCRNPKQPPGMVLKPCFHNGISTTVPFQLVSCPDFWTIHQICVPSGAKIIWSYHLQWVLMHVSLRVSIAGSVDSQLKESPVAPVDFIWLARSNIWV